MPIAKQRKHAVEDLVGFSICWIVSTQKLASVCMVKLHADARRSVTVSRSIDQIDSLGFKTKLKLKILFGIT